MRYFTEYDMYLFGQGTHYDIYRKLGAHPAEENGQKVLTINYPNSFWSLSNFMVIQIN